MTYEETADELVKRILLIIPDHPELLEMDNDPWKLFKMGLKCDDLSPTLFQASWALAKAKQVFKENNNEKST
jgi:hypothetical protein